MRNQTESKLCILDVAKPMYEVKHEFRKHGQKFDNISRA